MKRGFWCLISTATIILGLFSQPMAIPPGQQMAHGQYVVERVAMCGDCHTPRGPDGAFDRKKWLHGTSLDFQPIQPIPNWASYAPPLAGLPGWTTADAIRFLRTGLNRSGQLARPPMPHYRMSRQDAVAVVAYLKSLKAP